MPTAKQIEAAYKIARDRYEALGVNADKACTALAKIPISLHCWQGDDVGGFENQGGAVGGGLAVTGNYPGRARTPEEALQRLREERWAPVYPTIQPG